MPIQLAQENSPKVAYLSPKSHLEGRTFLVTRTLEGNFSERSELEKWGAEVIELETLKLIPPSSWEKLDYILSILDQINWIIFTSGNGVRFFFGRILGTHVKGSGELFPRSLPEFACIGPSTAKALELAGFTCSFQPSEFLTTTLGEELAASFDIFGKRIALARVEDASLELGDCLRDAGAEVIEVPVYAIAPTGRNLSAQDLDRVTDITLMSPSAVDGLRRTISPDEITKRRIRVHCIGPVTARATENAGLELFSVSNAHTLEGLIQMIIDS